MIRLITFGATLAQGLAPPLSCGRPLGALIFLSLQRQMVSRQELAHILWDPGSVRSDNHSLSQLLYALKQSLPQRVLLTDPKHVVVDPEAVSTDYTEFFRAFADKQYAAAIAIYRGGFLNGFPIVSEAFDEWRTERAAAAESAAIEAYRTVVERHLAAENLAVLPELCARALQIARHDPFFIRVQIEALAAQENVGAALATYGLQRRLLIRETGSVPTWMNDDFVARISRLSQLESTRDRGEVAVPFVGRVVLLKTLRSAWHHSQKKAEVIRLVGDAGVGKSRLLEHFVRRTVLEGARVHLHKCEEADALVPYAAIVGVLLSNYRAEVIASLNPQLRGALASVAPELAVDGQTVQYQQRVVFEAFAQYFAVIAQSQPLVLAIDDFQWSDDASQAALHHVIRRLEHMPALVLYATRPDRSGYSDDAFPSIVVDCMNVAEVDQLIQYYERLYTKAFDHESIFRRTGGNPFFILQLLQYLNENAGAGTDLADGMSLPASISRVLRSRLGKLSEVARRTAAAAAVLNRSASVAALSDVSGLPEIDVAHGVDELVRAGIVQDGHNCQFVHDLMRQAAYHDTSVALLEVLHQRAAKALMARDVVPSELAYHFELAGFRAEAWYHARAAAEEAIRLAAYREAEAQFQRMHRCASADQSDETQAEHLTFLYNVDRLRDGQAYVEAAERHAARTAGAELALICAVARYVGGGVPTLECARALIDEAQRRFPTQLPRVIRHVFKGSGPPEILKPLGRMLREETSGKAGAHRHAIAGVIAGMTEGYELGLPVLEHGVNLAEQSQDTLALIATLISRGIVRTWAGLCAGARSDFERVLALNEDVGSIDCSLSTTSNLAVVYLEQGELDRAEACARRALALGPPTLRSFAAANLALLNCRRGDYRATRVYVELLEHDATREFQKWIPLQTLAFRGLCSIGEQDWDLAIVLERELASFAELETLPIDLATVHEFVGQVVGVRDGAAHAESYLLEKSTRVFEFDYLAGARLALLATKYFACGQDQRIESIATPILHRASQCGATAVADQASRVLEPLGSTKHRGTA